jgi:hypothetical protein
MDSVVGKISAANAPMMKRTTMSDAAPVHDAPIPLAAANPMSPTISTGRRPKRSPIEPTEPGWFRTAFAVPRTTDTFAAGEGVGAGGLGPYELLGARLDELFDTAP